jgi:hypothetical protein
MRGAHGALGYPRPEYVVTVELLIQAVVRQTAILVAQLATTGGVRAPLSQIANLVFIDLVKELERLGVSHNVSADMFGLGVRTYRRKIRRVIETSSDRGRSLRGEIVAFLKAEGIVTRGEVLERFPNDDEVQIRAVLRDLRENQVVFSLGKGQDTSYRIATDQELAALKRKRREQEGDDFHVALMFREGSLTVEQIAERAQAETMTIEAAIARLAAQGRIHQVNEQGEAKYRAEALLIPLGAPDGWEAAVYDHFKAVVGAVLGRLRANQTPPLQSDRVGGSTYTIDVWQGHPLYDEVYGTLQRLRAQLSDLRLRVRAINDAAVEHPPAETVAIYAGQYIVDDGARS